MTEGTLRTPHRRTYVSKTGAIAEVEVNDHGVVQISEELLDRLLRATGLTETTKDKGHQ
jgi:hypothetical protein